MHTSYIKPNWPAPKNIIAFTSTRFNQYGKSISPYNNFNLATHVNDDLNNVKQNRELLRQDLQLPNDPCWLQQEHTTNVIRIDKSQNWQEPIADASYTLEKNIICVVLTADCLPILITDQEGCITAAIHAGWKGLATGIIEATIKSLPVNGNKLIAWMGPAIGPSAFIVGEEVKQQFISFDPKANHAFIAANEPDKWLCNMYIICRQRLNSVGVTEVYGGEFCTYSDPQKFYSFRRDNGITGRMATLIYNSP